MKKIWLALFAVFVAGSLCFGQNSAAPKTLKTIMLKSGVERQGKLVEQTDKEITIKVFGASVTYDLDDVESIDGDPVEIAIKKQAEAKAQASKASAPLSISTALQEHNADKLIVTPEKSLEFRSTAGETVSSEPSVDFAKELSPQEQEKTEKILRAIAGKYRPEEELSPEERAAAQAVVQEMKKEVAELDAAGVSKNSPKRISVMLKVMGSVFTDENMLKLVEAFQAGLQDASETEEGAASTCPLRKKGPIKEFMNFLLVLAILQIKYKYFFWFLSILSYFYYSFCLYLLAKRTYKELAWIAWIPIVNLLALPLMIAEVSLWNLLLLLLSVVPVLNIFIFLWWFWFYGSVWCKVAVAVNKPWWLGILMVIPIVGIVTFPVILGYLAFSRD